MRSFDSLCGGTAIGVDDLIVSGHDLPDVPVEFVRQANEARNDSPLDGILPELLFRALLQQLKKIILHHAHGDLPFEILA